MGLFSKNTFCNKNGVDESVVVDNNIVTSRAPDDLDDFNRETI